MNGDFDTTMSAAIVPLREAGFALHWLHPREKRPKGNGWSTAPVASLDDLRRTHSKGDNLGVRLGEPSLLANGQYLHVIDVDIRIAELAEEARDALTRLLPNWEVLPRVKSGSGGDSFHVYLSSDRPFSGRKLLVSEGKHRDADGKWHYDWEIELFGTGKQVVVPPSIHPDTGKPYVWQQDFDADALDFDPPEVDAGLIESWGAAETVEAQFETRPPLDFKPGQLERDLAALSDARLDDYHDWIMLGQALHHQFGASDEGFDLWVDQSKRSPKFEDTGLREMKRKWRGFGKHRGKPVTMASVRLWAQEDRAADLVDEFDDFEDADADGANDFDDLVTPAAAPKDDFDTGPDEKPGDLPWRSLLDVTEEGAYKGTLHNVELIVKNDERLVGLPQLNEFTQETVQRQAPGRRKKTRANQSKPVRQLAGRVWEVKDTLNGEIWSSARDYAIRSILEAPKTQGGYAMKITDRDLKAAIVLSAWESTFHPVREYLTGLKWDGTSRVETLFIDYLGVEDSPYTRAVARLMMIAAVARVFEPGHKWDFAVILEGLQGRGKSTFIRTLGKSWFAELEGDFHDGKEMVEKMQGAWIMEIPELSGFNRADVRSIKAFISRQVDKVRLAYEARATEFPRQCILIGSTNDKEYLKDDTGGRRFFPMECRVEMIDSARLRGNIDQLWAEARAIFLAMREEQPHGDLPLYLDGAEAAAEAARLQESRRVESSDDALIGRIESWLDRPVYSGSVDAPGEGGRRNITCLVEVWEGLGNDPQRYEPSKAQSLGRAMARVRGWKASGRFHNFPHPLGRQRYYERVGSLGPMLPIEDVSGEF